MNTIKEKLSEKKQELIAREKLGKIIRDWAGKNKKIFWKYEVSCFYKTYLMRITNLPKPSTEDIMVSSNNRLLNNQQKTQLCNAIEKACTKVDLFSDSSLDVQIDYVDGSVIIEVI